MDKRILLAAAGIVIVIVGVFVAFSLTRGGDPVPTPASGSAAPSTPTESAAPSAAPATAGAYVDYNQTAITEAEGRILLFFHAPWCPQCRSVEADIVAQGVPAGVTIIKVDYDSNQGLRQQYGVTLQTTFVEVDGAGTALQSYIAYDDPHLDAVVDAML
jgi:thiol-disulfide isomerase/thioredoxin